MEEIWKDVVGYEGRYKVSNTGKVLSMKYGGHDVVHLMHPTAHYNGYKMISLGRAKKIRFVHVLVAEAFIENPDRKPFVNHIDGDKTNNRADNLEWVTCLENVRHAIKTGLRDPRNVPQRYGADNHASKPVLQYDAQGNFVKKWDCQSDAARYFRIRPGTIANCIDRKTKLCKGFMWVSCEKDTPESSIERKISPSKSRFVQRKILQFTMSGEFVREWSGAQEIRASGLYSAKSAVDCCRGKQKNHAGYVWKFAGG